MTLYKEGDSLLSWGIQHNRPPAVVICAARAAGGTVKSRDVELLPARGHPHTGVSDRCPPGGLGPTRIAMHRGGL